MVAKESLLPFRRPTRANDANGVLVVARGVHDENEALFDGPDSDESVLFVRVRLVKYLEVLASLVKKNPRLLKRDAMLLLVCKVLGFIPDDLHRTTKVHWLTKSTA